MVSGLNHFMKHEMLAGYADSRGVPSSAFMVPFTGLLLFMGGASIITGAYVPLGLSFLAVFLVGVTPVMHDFWTKEGEERDAELNNFMKNAALLGALMLTYYMWVALETFPYTIGSGI